MFKLITLAVAGLTSCAMPAVQRELEPAKVPAVVAAPGLKPACDAGDVIISVDEETPCDLIGGQNRLIITDISVTDCDHAGGRHDGDDACVGADF